MATRKKYYQILKDVEDTDLDTIPIKLSFLPTDLIDKYTDESDELLELEDDGSTKKISVFYGKKSSKSELDELKKTYQVDTFESSFDDNRVFFVNSLLMKE